jgi:hypothetical protein
MSNGYLRKDIHVTDPLPYCLLYMDGGGDVFFKFSDISGHFISFALPFPSCHECREIHTILLILVSMIPYDTLW